MSATTHRSAAWQVANRAYVVSSSPQLIRRVKVLGNVEKVFDDARPPVLRSLIRAMRPHQWMKNLLVFVPLLAAQLYGEPDSFSQAFVAFLIFGLTASSVYLLNDMVDIADDRHHQRKRLRPFAAGDLSLVHGWLAWPLLFIAALGMASFALPAAFVGALITYIFLTFAYSFRLKQCAILDVLTLATLYTLRIFAGAAAISVQLSFWLMTFSMFIFLSLAFIKRYSELKTARDNNNNGWIRGRGYVHEDMEMISSMGTGAGYLAVLVLALYIQDSHTSTMYHSPQFIWLACPLLLFWISRVWIFAHRGWMHDDPIVFALKDRVSWIVGICFVVVFALATVVK
jgi:4-hydroxybenzoate polyprenyltransferase